MSGATGAHGEGVERIRQWEPSVQGRPAVTVHVPDLAETIITNVLGFLLAVLGFIVWVSVRFHGRLFPTQVSVGVPTIAALVGLTLASIVAHEALRALAVRIFGGRPKFGAGELHGVPYLYSSAPGHLFTRAQYIVIALLPNVVISPFMYAMALWGPGGGNWILPALVHIASGMGDLWTMGKVAAAPGTVKVEDLREGVALHHLG